MSILASSQPLKLSYDLSVESLAACQGLLRQRRDYDEKLSEAFEELVTIAQAEEAEAGSIDSLQEAGLFFSARSSFRSEMAEIIANLNSPTINSPLFNSSTFNSPLFDSFTFNSPTPHSPTLDSPTLNSSNGSVDAKSDKFSDSEE